MEEINAALFSKKILLLTDVAPTTKKTGGLVLHQLCQFLRKESFVCFVIADRIHFEGMSPDLSGVPVMYYLRFNEYIRTIMHGPTTSFLDRFYHQRLIKKIINFAQRHQVNALWCILEGSTLIQLARPLAEKLNIPLYTEVWDPPDWWLRARKFPPREMDAVLDEFSEAISASRACATASIAMAEDYTKRFKVKAVPFLPSLKEITALPPAKQPHNRNKFIIALAGQIYATKEWNALIKALDQVDWTITGKKVIIRLLGRFNPAQFGFNAKIEICGWLPQKKVLELMADSDVLYCPYWFDKEFEQEARLSFPSKLTTYLAAGRPVFFHGPVYASPAQFLKANNAGYCCHSLEINDIIAGLKLLSANTEIYQQYSHNGRLAFDKYLTMDSLRRNFNEFLEL